MTRTAASLFLSFLLPIASPPLWGADDDAAPTEPLAGHSHEGAAFDEGPRQFATPIPGCGDVHFPITTDWPEGQRYFDQGIGQLHGFWFFEAERTFRHIAAHDPECAIAYWGMAMANWENAKRAGEFIAMAVKLRDHAGPEERMWIDAHSAYRTATGNDANANRRALIRALEDIIHEFPRDIEAKAFLACRIWQFSRKGVPIASHEAVDALLQQVFAVAPHHPAHHYRIHLWDKENAARALDSAAILAQTAPAIAHMWHMPGHIYSELHRYADAAWHQEASARVAHRRMAEQRVLPDQIHNYAHNSEWLIRNLTYLGRAREALAISKSLLANPRHPDLNTLAKGDSSAHYGRERLIDTLGKFELWNEAVALAETSALDEGADEGDKRARLRLLGRAWFGLDDAPQLAAVVAEITALRDAAATDHKKAQDDARAKAKAEKKDDKAVEKAVADAGKAEGERVRVAREVLAELAVYQAILDGRDDDARAALADVMRPKRVLARLHLRLDQRDDALRLSKEAVDEAKNQTLPLAARVEVLFRCGDEVAAREAFAKLKALSAGIDLSAPPFHRLEEIALGFGEPSDWRIAPVVRDDVGERPDLATLGPLDWSPPPAPEFTLPDADKRPLSLASYRGRPLVVLFYLGHGCLHCVEQLNAFAPKYGAFREAGIDMLAVSTDSVADLRISQRKYSEDGTFPFPLVADPGLGVFKAYRAHDDFEQQPMHGTFLIDANGRILWQDIGAEPFDNPDFLLREAKRLLAIHGRTRGA